MAVDIINNDLRVTGNLTAGTMTIPSAAVNNAQIGASAAIERSKLAEEAKASYPIPWTWWRVWDAYQTVLPNPSANDDLGLYGGTWATDSPYIACYDVKTLNALPFYARATIPLPAEYMDAGDVDLRFHARTSAAADTSCTLDVVAYESDTETGIGADLCATAATSINNATWDDYDYSITAAGLVAGNILDVRIHVAINDGAGGASVQAMIGAAFLRCDIQG